MKLPPIVIGMVLGLVLGFGLGVALVYTVGYRQHAPEAADPPVVVKPKVGGPGETKTPPPNRYLEP